MSFPVVFGLMILLSFVISVLVMKYIIGPRIVEPLADYLTDKIAQLVEKI